MGRKKMPREKRRVNLCITLSPEVFDMLDDIIENEGVKASQYISDLIADEFRVRMHHLGMVQDKNGLWVYKDDIDNGEK
jgi:hypothetical protein